MTASEPASASPSLPPTVRALGWTSFLTDLSSEAIYPLLPAFVKSLGGTSLHVGLVDGVANAVAAIVRLPSGAASDRLGRRPLVLAGYGLSAVVRPLMGLVATPAGAILVRALDRCGKGMRSAPRDALVADLVPPAMHGRGFGHIRAMDHAGAALGPLVAAAFLWVWPGEERRLFLLSIVPGLVTLAVVWRFVRDPPRHTPVAARVAPAGRGKSHPGLSPGMKTSGFQGSFAAVFHSLRSSRPFFHGLPGPWLSGSQAWLLGAVGIWSLGAASEQFLLMRTGELGVPNHLRPLVWLAINLAKSRTAAAAGGIVDSRAPRTVLAAGWLVFAAAYAGLAATAHVGVALVLMLVVGVAYGIAEPAERALVAALSPAGRQGSGFGWYQLVQGLMALPASVLAGWLWDRGAHGPAWAFATTAALATAAAGIVLLGRRGPDASAPRVAR